MNQCDDLLAEMNPPVPLARYVAKTLLPVDPETAFAYHERPGCLQRLTPPWESVSLAHSDGSLAPGSRVVLKTKILGRSLRWKAVHTHLDRPYVFADLQESGPFRFWFHQHRFHSTGPASVELTDDIAYQVPFGAAGRLFGDRLARGTIEAMFAYRHRITRDDLSLAKRVDMPPRTIAVSGASGLVGQSLCSLLTLLGHRVMRITRGQSGNENEIAIWGDPAEATKLEQVDVVVHLAGKSIASGRWNDQVKKEIRSSRVEKTRQLCESIAACSSRPETLICASATGIYGDRGEEVLTERSSLGDDFLADVGRQWEEACQPARDANTRVVNARFGIVMAPSGGALQKMLTPAKLFGGSLGSGQQWWSWIALDDVVGAIVHAIATPQVSGSVNFVAPEPMRNADVAKTLARVLRRKALVPAPAFGLRMALGEMADALLLSSTRVQPERLIETGYQFRFEQLESLLRYCLGKERLNSVE